MTQRSRVQYSVVHCPVQYSAVQGSALSCTALEHRVGGVLFVTDGFLSSLRHSSRIVSIIYCCSSNSSSHYLNVDRSMTQHNWGNTVMNQMDVKK